jgi:hypothetical protein
MKANGDSSVGFVDEAITGRIKATPERQLIGFQKRLLVGGLIFAAVIIGFLVFFGIVLGAS